MRRARLTYQGAYHHIMNRGIKDENIFAGKENKSYFTAALKEKAELHRIKLLAYCIMNNHYHLILQNTTGRINDFMKQLNAQYGTYYRRNNGGRGYVFQNRYKSTLIQEDRYLKTAIAYTLMNPVRAGIVKSPYKYHWTSIREYFTDSGPVKGGITDKKEVEDIFGTVKALTDHMAALVDGELEKTRSRAGDILGDKHFVSRSIKLFERRKKAKGTAGHRIGDYTFKTKEQVIEDFENEHSIKMAEIDTSTIKGKRMRCILLVKLKDEAGMKYGDILKIELFRSLRYDSLTCAIIPEEQKQVKLIMIAWVWVVRNINRYIKVHRVLHRPQGSPVIDI